MGWRYPGQDFALRLPNGTAAIPALAFSGNPDTGLYYDTTNGRLAMAFDGADVMRWDGGGPIVPTGITLQTLGILQVASAFRLSAESVKTSTPYSVASTDAIIIMNAGVGQILTLQASPPADMTLLIRAHAQNLTVQRNGKNINGAAADLTVTAGTAVVMNYNGTEWWVVG